MKEISFFGEINKMKKLKYFVGIENNGIEFLKM